jgi:DNA helicase HerA-like ATPase
VNKDELLRKFEKWLKEVKKMRNQNGIAKKRNNIITSVSVILSEILKKDSNLINNLNDLKDQLQNKIKELDKDAAKPIGDFIEFLDGEIKSNISNHGEEEKKYQNLIEMTKSIEEKPIIEDERQIIGRVTLTTKSVAKPTEFEFWVVDDPNLHLEIGDLITVIPGVFSNENKEDSFKIIGIVTDMYVTSATETPIEDFYSTGYGDANIEPPTARPIIRVAKATIVFRSDFKFEPPLGNWPVYKATSDEIDEAYNQEIDDEYAILAGFTWDDKYHPVPIYIDSRYVLGYEGAHVNISGASGLATKTSYALFLIYSIMDKAANKNKFSVAAVLFNVKEADLMRIDEGPKDWNELFKRLNDPTIDPYNVNYNQWNKMRELGYDPFLIKSKLKFFAPPIPNNPGVPFTFRNPNKSTDIYSYGLEDIVQTEGVALSSLLELEDLDEKTLALISSIYDEIKNNSKLDTFKKLLIYLDGISKDKERKGGSEWIQIGGGVHHNATFNKVRSRLNQAINHQLKGLLLPEEAYGKPVPIENIKDGDIFVIDISKLHSKGQRLVFMHIYETINKILEAKRNKEKEIKIGTKTLNLQNFPERIIVFVDELNKFAPSGKGTFSIKSSVVDITARGRSIGLSLIGAEQIANQIDEEILSNTSTFVVGRSHSISLRGDIFHWLQEGLKDRVMLLEKGDMILWHAIHSRPLLISFPIPIHFLEKE